jgi:hypothetical protein
MHRSTGDQVLLFRIAAADEHALEQLIAVLVVIVVISLLVVRINSATVTTPLPPHVTLFDVAMVSANERWAVGKNDAYQTLLMHHHNRQRQQYAP